MCEGCNKVREDAWAAIRDLLNYNRAVNGPISAEMKKNVEKASADPDNSLSEDEIAMLVESVRAQKIAEFAVAIARACQDTEFHMVPAHVIMGSWAGELMRDEMMHRLMEGGGIIGLLLGNPFMGREPNEDDDDE